MPVWEDFFAYGYPLNKIFKFDAIRSEDDTATVSVPAKPSFKDTDIEPNGDFKLSKTSKIQEDDDDDDDEPVVVKKASRAKVEDEDDDEGFTVKPPVKAAPKRVPVSLSDDDDDDEEDGSTMGWIGK
jgi:exopolysaccharide biosynthesis protein